MLFTGQEYNTIGRKIKVQLGASKEVWNLYSSNIIRVTKSGRMERAKHVTHLGERNAYIFFGWKT
jgi:hypothetical protein